MNEKERMLAVEDWLHLNGIEEICDRCGGFGRRAYPSTALYHGGIGGQAVTSGTCDKCWGSGDQKYPYTSLKLADHKKYKMGLAAGIIRFAWWKDGIQYVGTAGKTLKKALEEAKNDTSH